MERKRLTEKKNKNNVWMFETEKKGEWHLA